MPTPTASIASILSEYEISRELGRGAMGVVYLGRHRRLGRAVAIKELSGALADDPEVRSRFLTEARTLATLDHPHVVPIYDYVESGGRCLLIMEALPGGTVWSVFTSSGLTVSRSVALVLAACAGVHHAHQHGVLHRDLKPENLLFTADGDLKVADFGIAKVLDGGRTLATVDGSVLGTPAYMSPEQAEGATVGPQADVYALGTILFELLSGRLPFEADSPMALLVQRITNDPPELRSVAPGVPPPIADMVMHCLQRDPAARPASAEALGCALGEAAVASLGVDWLNASGVSVSGSRAILLSATTGGRGAASGAAPAPGESMRGAGVALPTVAPRSSAEAAPTIAPRSAGEAAATIAPRTGAEAMSTPVDAAAAGAGSVVSDAASAVAATVLAAAGAQERAATTVVRPQVTSHLSGIDASVRRSELVGVDEVTRSVAPLTRPALITLVALVIAVLAGLLAPRALDGSSATRMTVNGVPPGSAPVEVDLDAPVIVRGFANGRIASAQLRLAGVPVASAQSLVRNGGARFDLRSRARLVHGPAVLRVSLVAAGGRMIATREVAVVSSSAPWLSAQGPLLVVVALAALASAEASSARHRKGRVRREAMLAAGASGAVGAVALVVLWSIVRSLPAQPLLTVIAGLGAGVAFAALHVWRARLVRRRRIRWRADR